MISAGKASILEVFRLIVEGLETETVGVAKLLLLLLLFEVFDTEVEDDVRRPMSSSILLRLESCHCSRSFLGLLRGPVEIMTRFNKWTEAVPR